MKRFSRFGEVCALAAVLVLPVMSQGVAKKSYTFHGTVESVNQTGKTLTVNGEKVEGWMEAMTMNYKVDNPAILKTIKTGDRISAIVYDGDSVLLRKR